MRGGGLCSGIMATLAWTLAWGCLAPSAGCGDPPLCQSEVFVAFQQTVITVDTNDAAPGVQTDIHLRTSLEEGEQVTLEVFGEDGSPQGESKVPVGADGSAVFVGVSVPVPRAVLRATAQGLCGRGTDEITVDVPAGAGCDVTLSPEPEASLYFAPLGVLSTRSDPDPVTPGYQTTVRVATRAGGRVEVFQITGVERSLAFVTADASGV